MLGFMSSPFYLSNFPHRVFVSMSIYVIHLYVIVAHRLGHHLWHELFNQLLYVINVWSVWQVRVWVTTIANITSYYCGLNYSYNSIKPFSSLSTPSRYLEGVDYSHPIGLPVDRMIDEVLLYQLFMFHGLTH